MSGEELSEGLAHVDSEVEERERKERCLTKVDGDNLSICVLHEISTIHVGWTQAQAMFLDLGLQVDTLALITRLF